MSSAHAISGRPAGTARAEPVRSAAASTAVGWLVDGPPRAGQVLAVLDGACYLRIPGVGAGGVLAVISHPAVRLPNALVVQEPLRGVAAGDSVTVGSGSVSVAGLEVRARRRWDPSLRPGSTTPHALGPRVDVAARCLFGGRPARGATRALPGLASTPRGRPGDANGMLSAVTDKTAVLRDAVDAGDLRAVAAAADGLVGAGPGLTPAGDDVLVGFLVAARAVPPALPPGPRSTRVEALAAAMTDAVLPTVVQRTTAVSAALIDHAARGQGAAPLVALLAAVTGTGDVVRAATRLRRVGHTSGTSMGQGAILALAALAATAPPRSTPRDGAEAGRPAVPTRLPARQVARKAR